MKNIDSDHITKKISAQTIEHMIAWIQSPEGRKQLEESNILVNRVIADLQEKRKLPPDWREFRVTI